MDYRALGYDNLLSKADTGYESSEYIYPVDSGLLIGGLGAQQITGGDLNGDMTINNGAIVIKDEGGKPMIVINSAGIFIKDEISENDMLTLNSFGITLNDGDNDRVRVGIIDE